MGHKPERKRTKRTFEELTDAEKRVAVAKDVIKQLELKKIVATPGTYVYGHGKTDKQATRRCQACMLGGAILALARLQPKLRDDLVDVYSPHRGSGEMVCTTGPDAFALLEDLFGDQMLTIESAFEDWGAAGEAFTQKRPADRMIAICKNIIKNKGDLVLPGDADAE